MTYAEKYLSLLDRLTNLGDDAYRVAAKIGMSPRYWPSATLGSRSVAAAILQFADQTGRLDDVDAAMEGA